MSTTHTPEPLMPSLPLNYEPSTGRLYDARGELIATVRDSRLTQKENGRLAMRLAGSFNACAGIADPAAALKLAREALKSAIQLAYMSGDTKAEDAYRTALAALGNGEG